MFSDFISIYTMILHQFRILVFFLIPILFQSVGHTLDADSENNYDGDDSMPILDTKNVSKKLLSRNDNHSVCEDGNKFETEETDARIYTHDKQRTTKHTRKRSTYFKQLRSNVGKQETNNTGHQHCSYAGNCAINANISHPVCYCDVYCSIFRDCCFDVDDNRTPAAKYTEHYSRLLQYVECNRNERFYGTDQSRSGYYVIRACPFNFTNLEMIHKCQFSDFIHPVTSDYDGLSYINEYCALCHNVTKYRHWNTIVFRYSCRRLDILSLNETRITKRLAVLKKHCVWKFAPGEGSNPRICRNVSHSDIYSCPEFLNPVLEVPGGPLHRNYWCIEDFQNKFECIIPEDISTSEKGFGSHAVTVMFQMHPPMKVGNTVTCQSGETYFEDSEMCFPDDCQGWNLDDQCRLEAYTNHKITVKFWFRSDAVLRSDSSIALRVISALYEFIPTHYNMTIAHSFGYQCCNTSLHILTSFNIERKISLSNIAVILSNLQNINITYHEINKDSNVTLRRINVSNENKRKHLSSSSLIKFDNAKGEFGAIRSIMTTNISTVVEAIPTYLEIISFLEVSPTTGNLLKMSVKDVSREYKNITTSSNFGYKAESKKAPINIQGTITYICMCVSCTFLVATVFLYIYTGMYKSAPGTLSIHMMTCLLFSQIFFMSGMNITDKGYTLCLVLGILSHYLWLTTFVWVFLFMIHITKTIVRVHNHPNGSDMQINKVSAWNYVFGYGSAWLIVIPSILLELCQCSNIVIGYTSEVCFPTGYPGNMLVFTGPVLLCLLINCLMLVVNIRFISRYHTTVRSQSFNISRSYLFTYIKLCFISSCPWLIGFLGELLKSDVLKFIFVLLSSSHGFIVSLCFLSSKRIVNLIQRKSSLKRGSQIANTRL